MAENISYSKMTLSVHDIMCILGIGKNQAYNLVHEGYFPVVYIGRKMVVPKTPFFDWLNNCDSKAS